MPYLPGTKDTIEPPQKCRCHECKRPLTTGIGYFVVDEKGLEFPVGPKCFKDLTGHPTKSAPVLALGAVKKKGGSKDGKNSDKFNEVSSADLELRRRVAQENLLLRAKKLPLKGFNTDAQVFEPFLPRINNLSQEDICEIELRVSRIERNNETKTLKQLKWCNTVYGQMQRLLDWEHGYPLTKSAVLAMRERLRTYNGLLDRDMDKLSKWSAAAKKFGVANSIEGMHFSINQAQYDRAIQRKSSPSP